MDWQAWLAEQRIKPPSSAPTLVRGVQQPRPVWTPWPPPAEFDDLLVRTPHPEGLASVLALLPMSRTQVLMESWDGDSCTVRCYRGCVGFVRFAIDHQGYGEVLSD